MTLTSKILLLALFMACGLDCVIQHGKQWSLRRAIERQQKANVDLGLLVRSKVESYQGVLLGLAHGSGPGSEPLDPDPRSTPDAGPTSSGVLAQTGFAPELRSGGSDGSHN